MGKQVKSDRDIRWATSKQADAVRMIAQEFGKAIRTYLEALYDQYQMPAQAVGLGKAKADE
jgi:hypothetical protein